jgi:hypothetical protein
MQCWRRTIVGQASACERDLGCTRGASWSAALPPGARASQLCNTAQSRRTSAAVVIPGVILRNGATAAEGIRDKNSS